jgi:ABC-2 type transport system ATP-binding protein
LKESLALANLESVFAQLVRQQDTQSVARELVDVMAAHHV